MIDEILKEISNNQAAADEKNRNDEATFNETINGLINQICEQKVAIETLTSSIKDNQEILQQAKIDLNRANQDYVETIQTIETGTAQRGG